MGWLILNIVLAVLIVAAVLGGALWTVLRGDLSGGGAAAPVEATRPVEEEEPAAWAA